MSIANPFASYQIAVPKNYADQIKTFCKQSNSSQRSEFIPFNRQVDFWYFSFLYAASKNLAPEHYVGSDMSNITAASILSDYHIIHFQMAYLADNLNIEKLIEYKEMFNYVSDLANAGIPHVIQSLKDTESGNPLFNILELIEENL